jgi:hypothetical protein
MKFIVALIALAAASSATFAADQDFRFTLKSKAQVALGIEAFWPHTEEFLSSKFFKIQSAAGYSIREIRGVVTAEPEQGNLPPGSSWHRVNLSFVMGNAISTVDGGLIGRETYARIVSDLEYDLGIRKP